MSGEPPRAWRLRRGASGDGGQGGGQNGGQTGRRRGFGAWLGRLLRRLLLLALLLVLGLLSPVAYVELLCRPEGTAETGAVPILPPEHHRAESNTLLTYPEWHIVHAYEDYAAVIRRGARTTTPSSPRWGSTGPRFARSPAPRGRWGGRRTTTG
jgi:hypothetical protein